MGRGNTNKNGRLISGDDARLWSHVARTTTPLSSRADRVPDIEDFAGLIGETPRQIGCSSGQARPPVPHPVNGAGLLPESSVGKSHSPAPHADPSRLKTPGPAPFDKRNLRRISRGRTGIDARIDLHGMRQREAHSALRSFLFNAHSKGHRVVLVITGKGAERSRNDDDWAMGRIEPGVLRRNVPHWLGEADLASIVVSHTTAGPRHGGEGALYLHLRRRTHPKPQA